jgi:hypothetical protein
MADLAFSKSKGTLTAFGKSWPAVSGIPGKHQPLPPGFYSVCPGSLMTGTERVEGVGFDSKYAFPAYKDRTGFGWSLRLGQGNLDIHPDGSIPGIDGCIAITSINTRDLFDELRQRNGQSLTVSVE